MKPAIKLPLTDQLRELRSTLVKRDLKHSPVVWDPIEQLTESVDTQFGQWIRFDPSGSPARHGYLPSVAGGDIGEMVGFGNWSSSTTAYTIHACPGELIDGQATATISQAWRKVICIAVGPGKWSAFGSG